jgi:hypothetical protein
MTGTIATRQRSSALQPVLGPLVEGDLCDIRVGRRYCGHDATHEALDADGRTRLLCAEHVALYFPTLAISA